MSEARMGMKLTDEIKKKMSESKRGISINRGIKLDNEHRKKISGSLMGHSVSDESKDKKCQQTKW